MRPRRHWLGEEEEDGAEPEEEGAEPEESLPELADPDVVDEQHPSTAAPDSDVPTPSAAKPPVRRATPTKRIIRRPKAKAAVKRVFAKKPSRKRAAPKGKRRRVGMLYIP